MTITDSRRQAGNTGAGGYSAVLDIPLQRDGESAVGRWAALGVFVVVSALNFLDRQLLAAVAPLVRGEFGLSNAEYGAIVGAFSMTYTVAAPIAGWCIDRAGLRVGTAVALASWSLAGLATGFAGSYRALLGCRMALGAAEAAGIPASSKSVAVFLRPREYALGIAAGNVGIMLGMSTAPLLAAAVAPTAGWRATFVIAGALGLLWVPALWLISPAGVESAAPRSAAAPAFRDLLLDRRLWLLLLANVLVMANYSLWLNWTTVYFVEQLRLTPTDANRYYAWIPPICAMLGAFSGGWLGWRRVGGSHGTAAAAARLRLCRTLSPALLLTASVPLFDDPRLVAAAICASVFACMTFLPNLHVTAIDLFGPGRAGFTAAALASSYALTQTVMSPLMGAVIDGPGFALLCPTVAAVSLLAVPVLRRIAS